MRTLTMPVRTNRLATLMVVAGIVGSGTTLASRYLLADEGPEPAPARLQEKAPEPKEQNLCRLARDLATSVNPATRATAEEMQKANGCSSR